MREPPGEFVAPPDRDPTRSDERQQAMCCGLVLMTAPVVLLYFMYQQRLAQQAMRATPPIGELVCVAAIGVPLALLGAWLLRKGWSKDARSSVGVLVDRHPLVLGATHRLRLTTRLAGPGAWSRARVTLVCEEYSDSAYAKKLRDAREASYGGEEEPGPRPQRRVELVVLERARTELAELPLEAAFEVPADAPHTEATGNKPRREPRGRHSGTFGSWSVRRVSWWFDIEVGEGPTLIQERQPVTVVAPSAGS